MALIFNFRGVKIENEEICKAKKQGKTFEFSDFTPEQLAGLKGEKGDTGKTGSKCAEPADGAFGYGEYRDDPEAASWNAGQGRSSLCRWRMACYANSRNGSNVSSL